MIDIRSDTVTGPTAAMRKAMAEAEVGDDVYGDDPTIKALEELGAELTGKEAALFVPSGTFGNQLALFTWSPRGTEVILGENCHIVQHEAAAASVIAGVQIRPIPDAGGVLKPEDFSARYNTTPGLIHPSRFTVTAAQSYQGRNPHNAATSLICMENAHSDGSAAPLSAMDAVYSFARERALPVHLDGARLFNAAAALGCFASDIASRADSVMFCLSKGLCAPVGSLLAGPADFIEEALCKRKIMGGGMRQAGILAAAGIIALKEHTTLLTNDHKRARKLEQALAEIPGLSVEKGNVNMVFFTKKNAVKNVVERFREKGILINSPGVQGAALNFRFVTHYWIGDAELETIIASCRDIFAGE